MTAVGRSQTVSGLAQTTQSGHLAAIRVRGQSKKGRRNGLVLLLAILGDKSWDVPKRHARIKSPWRCGADAAKGGCPRADTITHRFSIIQSTDCGRFWKKGSRGDSQPESASVNFHRATVKHAWTSRGRIRSIRCPPVVGRSGGRCMVGARSGPSDAELRCH